MSLPLAARPIGAGSSLRVIAPPFAYYVDRLREGRPFTYTKINHGFWEQLLAGAELRAMNPALSPEELDRATRRSGFFAGGFIDELAAQLCTCHASDDFFFALSPGAFAHSDRIEGTPRDRSGVVGLMESMLPRDFVAHDGLVWKTACFSGEIRSFFAALADRDVVLVGPQHLAAASPLASRSFEHLVIHETRARQDRRALLTRILDTIGDRETVLLIQAGTLATWLAFELHGRLARASIIDVGRAVDIRVPSVVFKQNWAQLARYEFERNLGLVDPATAALTHGHAWTPPYNPPAHAGVSLLGEPVPPPGASGEPLPFVEDKPVDLRFVEHLLDRSRAANKWTNYGPVGRELEARIAGHLGIPPHRRVIAMGNGAAALFAVAALHEFVRGRRLRWVVSAFGFRCTRQGPFADAIVIDCDSHGQMSLAELERLDPASYDGVCVTNVFGYMTSLAPYAELCRAHDKLLLCDAAAAFDAGHRQTEYPFDEIVSFHHTKPWGMGEGGCAIVAAEHEDTLRSLINFGLYRGIDTGGLSTNAKMSDFAAAFIVQRLRDFAYIAPHYRRQYRRVTNLAARFGLTPLNDRAELSPHQGTPPCAALLSNTPITLAQLDNPAVVLRKYYAPLDDSAQRARDIYARVVNVPCHPGLQRLGDEALIDMFATITRRAP